MNGFIPKSQLFGSAAAVLHYNCLSRVIASLACRILKLPCVGYYDDFLIVATRTLIDKALEAFTMLNDLLLVILKKKKSEAGSEIEFLGVAISLLPSYEETLASLRLSEDRAKKLVELMEHLASNFVVS